MKLRTLAILLVALSTCPLIAQEPYFDVLVPVTVPYPTPGAYGSSWQTRLWIHNGSPNPQFTIRGNCPIAPCFGDIPAGQTTEYPRYVLGSAAGAVVMRFPAEIRHQVGFSSRLFELSRHTQPAGVEIPVVFSDEFFSAPVRFVAVNGNSSNRVALRVYHPVPSGSGVVRIDFLLLDGTLILSTTLPMKYFWERDYYAPGSAAITDLAGTFPELRGIEPYDIVVSPLTPSDMKFYALVSVTDLDTQQVLMITTKP